jgi:hypothetical protein
MKNQYNPKRAAKRQAAKKSPTHDYSIGNFNRNKKLVCWSVFYHIDQYPKNDAFAVQILSGNVDDFTDAYDACHSGIQEMLNEYSKMNAQEKSEFLSDVYEQIHEIHLLIKATDINGTVDLKRIKNPQERVEVTVKAFTTVGFLVAIGHLTDDNYNGWSCMWL